MMKMKHYAQGGFADYYIDKNIGLKIFKNSSKTEVELEYLITLFVEQCGIVNSTKVLGMDTSHNIIYMKHIKGVTFEFLLEKAMSTSPTYLTDSYDNLYDFAINTEILKPYINQYNILINELISIGLSCDDHLDNFTNFIVDRNNILHVIDFSAVFESDEFKYMILTKMVHYLETSEWLKQAS